MQEPGDSQPMPTSPKEQPPPKSVFYPGIAGNNLVFHGTGNRTRLNDIVNNGLRPPHQTTISRDTLASRISFCEDPRYGGGTGYIIAFKPKANEVDRKPSQFDRTMAISDNLDVLPKDRVVFYIPVKDSLAIIRDLSGQARALLVEFARSGFNQQTTLDRAQVMVILSKNMIKNYGVFVGIQPTEEQITQLAQEVAWNEIRGAVTHIFDQAISSTQEFHLVVNANPDASLSTIETEMRKSDASFSIAEYSTQLDLLAAVPTASGLGFEGRVYDVNNLLSNADNVLKSKVTT